METTTSTSNGIISPTLQLHTTNIPDENPLAAMELPLPSFLSLKRHCFGNSAPGEFFLASCPSIVLHLLTTCDLSPRDLANLEASHALFLFSCSFLFGFSDFCFLSSQATCSFFRKPANFSPDLQLSISEVAALDICQKKAVFERMGEEDRQDIKRKCGGSWKLVLRFLLAGELGCRREKSQALAGPGHSIAVTSKGVVYSFGSNTSGQLGQGTVEDTWQPRPIRLTLTSLL